jgi:hypothetical protein
MSVFAKHDYDKFDLIIGENALSIFNCFDIKEMHGLSMEKAITRINEGGTYIDGLTNVHPIKNDEKPFIFLNLSSVHKLPEYKIISLIMHETMHMAVLLWNGCIDSHEEEMITWAEETANKIYENIFL